ncbi:hypothetical protein ElyMa_005545300 [Elysia marginata]|uniref:Uncharacterized protein n=1 Tax=Elysia marginata TaxID=1093978 RepID=A0AAV4EY45_9GAST|nr:hypothetical protein ElyMa_005545300 [Elysia marginata]
MSHLGFTSGQHARALLLVALAWSVSQVTTTSSTLSSQCTMVPLSLATYSSSGQSSEEPTVTDVKVASDLSECALLCCMEAFDDFIKYNLPSTNFIFNTFLHFIF